VQQSKLERLELLLQLRSLQEASPWASRLDALSAADKVKSAAERPRTESAKPQPQTRLQQSPPTPDDRASGDLGGVDVLVAEAASLPVIFCVYFDRGVR